MRNLLAQDGVRRQPDGVGEPGFFQPLIDRRDRVGGIGPEEPAAKATLSIPGDDGVENIPPVTSGQPSALWTLPWRRAQRFSMPNWLNRKFGW